MKRIGDTHQMFQSIEQKFSSWDLLKISCYPHGYSTHAILILGKKEEKRKKGNNSKGLWIWMTYITAS